MDSEYSSRNYTSFWKKLVFKATDVTPTPSIYTINPPPYNSELFSKKDTYHQKKDVDEDIVNTSNNEQNRVRSRMCNAVHKRKMFNQVLAATSIALVSLVTGFVSAFTSPVTESIKNELEISDKQISWIGGLVPLGALGGGLIGGLLIDVFGRKSTIFFANLLFLIGWTCMALAPSVEYLFAARAITGFSVGIASLAMPIYLGETIEPKIRGTLGLLPTAFGNIGILICFLAGTYLSWKNLAWLGAVLSLPFLLLVFVIPETPRWYMLKQEKKKAFDSLQWFRGLETDVQVEFAHLLHNHKETKNNCCVATTALFQNYWPLVISLGLMFFQQFCGIPAVIYYTNDIFKMSGSSIDKNLSTVIVGIVNFISTFIAAVLVDKLGRKILLCISSISMIATLVTLGTYFYLIELRVDVNEYGWVPLVSFVIYVLGFSLGFGPVPWLMLGEIFSLQTKGIAASIVTAFHWACTFIVTKTFLDIIEIAGPHGVFWIFGIFCITSFVFVVIWLPETKGKTLQEIEVLVNLRKPTPYTFKP
ncbi:hypothetical protein RN001_015609 [Aquatica leii]|uniref:Major facilitator superfamily (MFS) profile domain-containing protein n=1 Tax=Aquatica leii TaxID=1421715 RepID=A0AAN7SMQ3_9COLE|nr:hypothetical protein RN001_015609 [Aquatica leii]